MSGMTDIKKCLFWIFRVIKGILVLVQWLVVWITWMISIQWENLPKMYQLENMLIKHFLQDTILKRQLSQSFDNVLYRVFLVHFKILMNRVTNLETGDSRILFLKANISEDFFEKATTRLITYIERLYQ